MENRQTLTPALIELAQIFMKRDGWASCGPLHIWFADDNSRQRDAAFCASCCWNNTVDGRDFRSWDDETARLGYYLARIGAQYLTTTQRGRLAKKAWDSMPSSLGLWEPEFGGV
jgi:hypothetical protein